MALPSNLVDQAKKFGSPASEPWKNLYGDPPDVGMGPKPTNGLPPGSGVPSAPRPYSRPPQYNNQFADSVSNAQSSVSPGRPDDYWSVEKQYQRMTANKPVTQSADFKTLMSLLPERTDGYTRENQIRSARMNAPDRVYDPRGNSRLDDGQRQAAMEGVRSRFAAEDAMYRQGTLGAYDAAKAMQESREGYRSTEQIAAEHDRAMLADRGLQSQSYAYQKDRDHDTEAARLGLDARTQATAAARSEWQDKAALAEKINTPYPDIPSYTQIMSGTPGVPAAPAAPALGAPPAPTAAPGAPGGGGTYLQRLVNQERTLQLQASELRARGDEQSMKIADSLEKRALAAGADRKTILENAVQDMGVADPTHRQFVLDYLRSHPEIDLSNSQLMGRVKAMAWMQSRGENIPQPELGTGRTKITPETMPYLAPDADQPRFMHNLAGSVQQALSLGMLNKPTFWGNKVKYYDRVTGEALWQPADQVDQGILNLMPEAKIEDSPDPNAWWFNRDKNKDRRIVPEPYFPK